MKCAIGIFKCWETMYPRVYCPGRGDSITREGTLYPRVNCPWGTTVALEVASEHCTLVLFTSAVLWFKQITKGGLRVRT